MPHPLDQTPHPDGPGVYVNVHVAGAAVLWSNDPDLAWEALSELELLLMTMVDDLGGEMMESHGDGYRVRFGHAAPAVMWCARMQEGLLALDWPDALDENNPGGRNQEVLYSGLTASMAIHSGSAKVLTHMSALVQPGQVLISSSTWQSVTDAVPPDLQVRPVGSANILGSPVELHQVTTRLLSRRRFSDLQTNTSSLPIEPDAFVGRQGAMADLMERLDAGAHMVNITGPEGIGKTRIAMRCIRKIQVESPVGVALVSLRHVEDDTEVLLATAAALDMALGTELNRTIAERIGHAIASRGRSIILFDGFEPNLDASVLDTWVRMATETRFLVTGRNQIDSERATHLHLGPMNSPDSRALFLARTHRNLRGQERPNHASQVEPSETIETGIAAQIEEAAGTRSPRWDDNTRSTLHLRRLALDESAAPAERVEACIELAPTLVRMGLGSVATELLLSVETVLEKTTLFEQWKCTRADLMLANKNFEELHTFFASQGPKTGDEQATGEWLLRKAQLALAEERFADAKQLLDEASQCGESPAIAHARGQSLAAMDEWENAVPWLKKAANELNHPIKRAHAFSDLGRVLQDLGRDTEGEKALTEAMALGAEDPHVMAKVHHHRFQGATARLALHEARSHLHRELECLKRCGDQAGHARAHIQMGLLDLVQHEPEQATPHFHEARDLCREAGLSTIEAHALTLGGVAARLSGDFGSALDAFAEATALAENQHGLLAVIHSHRGAVEAACDAVDNAVAAFQVAETHLEAGWDALASTIHDVLTGFIDLARARDAALVEDVTEQERHVDAALNRLARGSSFETRSTPPRGREVPSRINELRLARLLLDGALSALEPPN